MRTATTLLALLFALVAGWSLACSNAATGGTADADAGDSSVQIKPSDVLADAGADAKEAGDAAPEEADAEDVSETAEDVNGFNYPCEPLTKESCVTACLSAGKRKCLKEWGPCIPPKEFCGNCADDDCDGQVNEGCEPNPECTGPAPECPVAVITVAEGAAAFTGDTLHLSAASSSAKDGQVVKWQWSVEAPAGSLSTFQPSSEVKEPTFVVDVAGDFLFSLDVWDDKGTQSCVPAQTVVFVQAYPPVGNPEVGCADGEREGFLDTAAYAHVAGCAGAWDQPGVTPDAVKATCGNKGGDDGPNKEGKGCSSADLCSEGWHLCKGMEELAQKSSTGCAGATPPDAKSKSLFFALRQPSFNGSVCETWDKLAQNAFNDVFGCGNLGTGLGPDKKCGPLDRVLASTQANTCGFNEAEPPLGPWECKGGTDSHLNEGAVVTKKACTAESCQYDGYPIGTADKGGVLCCQD